MDKGITFRPRGKMYIVGLIAIYVFLVGLLSFSIVFILNNSYWALMVEILPLICLVWISIEVANYKIKLTDTKIHVVGQRERFTMRHKNFKIRYKDIKTIQYFFGVLQAQFVSVIAIVYNDGKLKYLDVSRFSEKQVNKIMRHIVDFAERYNSYTIVVLPDEIQKGFGQRKNSP